MLVNFRNSFTLGFSSKFVTRHMSHFPPHLKCVTALPCRGATLLLITIRRGRRTGGLMFEDRRHQAMLRRSLRQCSYDLACSARCASLLPATSPQRQPMSDAGVWFQPVFYQQTGAHSSVHRRKFAAVQWTGLHCSHAHRTDAVLAGSHVRCRGTEAADIEAAQVVAGRRVAVSPAAFVCYQDRAILAVTVADW